jgi:hypothetical protein
MEVLEERLSRRRRFLRSVEALRDAAAVRRRVDEDGDGLTAQLDHLVRLGRGLELLRLTVRDVERTPNLIAGVV